ncbi:MAG TPA: hypothetical protein VHF25_16570 [Nitriliruptorales bacterium]|nr:hypothetical protein [Nitriliruptorales bacterium]
MRSTIVGPAGSRSAVTAAVASVLALIPAVPHVLFDAASGGFTAFRVSDAAAGTLVGLALSLQLLAAYSGLRGRRPGHMGVLALSLAWVVDAVVGHYGAFIPGGFRAGMGDRVAVWGVLLLQGLAAMSALSALRASRRTSFSGTGSYGA